MPESAKAVEGRPTNPGAAEDIYNRYTIRREPFRLVQVNPAKARAEEMLEAARVEMEA